MNRLPLRLMTVVASLALAGGCDESPTRAESLSTDSPRFDLVGGNGQQGRAGTELPAPLVVRVTRGGAPVANQLVNFVVTAGGGSVYAGASVTNEEGLAQDYWTLGEVIGSAQEVQVRAVDPVSGVGLVYGSFTATALGPVASVAITPDSARIEEGGTVQLTATARDETGLALPGREMNWTSSDPGVATVDSNGRVRGVAAGSTTIRATSEGRFDEVTVRVTTPAIEITIAAIPDLTIGRTHQAVVHDGEDRAYGPGQVVWETSNSRVVTVSSNGLVRARAAGEAIITATVNGKRASTTVRVRSFWGN